MKQLEAEKIDELGLFQEELRIITLKNTLEYYKI